MTDTATQVRELPRLKRRYREEIRDALNAEFSYDNVMQIPGLVKVVVNTGVGEAARADRAAAEAVQDRGVAPGLLVDDDLCAGEQAVVAVLVADELDLRHELGVALDEPSDGGGQAGGVAARGEHGNAGDRHGVGLPLGCSVRRRGATPLSPSA